MPEQDLTTLLNLPKPIEWDKDQLEGIERCCDIKQRIVPITGKAGSGKTRIIEAVAARLEAAGYLVQCSAPTGKAAKRIQEATGRLAMTNHRMLGYGMPIEREMENEHTGEKSVERLSTGPKFTKSNPMPYDTVLADEYAMVNREINRNIIDALKRGARLCVFADDNQLKPIEEDERRGQPPELSPFQSLMKKFTATVLKTNHRTGEGSDITLNAERILAGRPLIKRPEFDIQYTSQPVKQLTDFVRSELDNGVDYSALDHQIITCQNKSWIGTAKLNPLLQQVFWNNDHRGLVLPRWRWDTTSPITVQVGTKVVYSANTYDMGNGESVFNGEIGTVVEIDHATGSLDIDFVDRVVSIPPLAQVETQTGYREFDPRCNINLAYVLTTHKMQGSECQHGIYIMNRATLYGQSRRNFYTGVTRCKRRCTVITDSTSMQKSLKYAG